jgi:hypothetical protein
VHYHKVRRRKGLDEAKGVSFNPLEDIEGDSTSDHPKGHATGKLFWIGAMRRRRYPNMRRDTAPSIGRTVG